MYHMPITMPYLWSCHRPQSRSQWLDPDPAVLDDKERIFKDRPLAAAVHVQPYRTPPTASTKPWAGEGAELQGLFGHAGFPATVRIKN